MYNLEEKKISSKKIFKGKLINLFLDKVKLPNGKIGSREWVDHPGAACVIPIMPNGDICFIKQYRYASKKVFVEIPAGKLDKNETPLDCAKRELSEEIGYTSNKLTFLTKIYPAIGFSNEVMWMYLGEDLVKTEMKLGVKTVSSKPFSSSILLVFRLIKPSILLQYSSNVLTSGGKELILGCILSIGKKVLLASLANLSFISLRA